MVMLLVDLVFLCAVLLVAALMFRRAIKDRNDKLEDALAEQTRAAELAKKAEQLNTEEILKNQAKVKETLDKLQ